MYKIEAEIPEWSLCYLINGDSEGLTSDEINMIENWRNNSWSVQIVDPIGENWESYFSWYPEFGEPCMVVDCNILYEL